MAIKEWGYQLSLTLVPYFYALVSRLLFGTCRVRYHGAVWWREVHALPTPFIATTWHYGVFNVLSLHPSTRKGWVAVVSSSRDAEYVARVLEKRGDKVVRGSRNRRGANALRKTAALMQEGLDAAIIADGSQGPARVAQAGAVLLASKLNAPVLPLMVAAGRYITFGSWDRTMLPKPFARLAVWYGEPLQVPSGLDATGLEQYRLELEKRLNLLYEQAWAEWGKKGH